LRMDPAEMPGNWLRGLLALLFFFRDADEGHYISNLNPKASAEAADKVDSLHHSLLVQRLYV